MAVTPLITFKAGPCGIDDTSKPFKVTPKQEQGYIYLYQDDDELVHFCWRKRETSINEPELDLLMMPTDGNFLPVTGVDGKSDTRPNGRIFVLKFQSSSSRHFFWLQSKAQANDKSEFSTRDIKIGKIVDAILQGEEVDVREELTTINNDDGDNQDETMEDVEGHGNPLEHHQSGGGGAGPDATGGDVREEGASGREGGADGGRAATGAPPAAAVDDVVQNFLKSIQGSQAAGTTQKFMRLNDLLSTSNTIPMINNASEATLDQMLLNLPATILILAQESAAQIDGMVEPSPAQAQAALEALSIDQKRQLLKRVLLSPQFSQGMGSLEQAIRDGGLENVAMALRVTLDRRAPANSDPLKVFMDGLKEDVMKENSTTDN